METLYPSNIDIYYSDSPAHWVNASLSTVGFGDTGVNAFLQFTIPAATIPAGQQIKSAKLYLKVIGITASINVVADMFSAYRDTTYPISSIGEIAFVTGDYAEIDITDIYKGFSGAESVCYLNIDSTVGGTSVYTDNAGSGDIPYLVVEYETTGSVIQYDDGTSFADKAIYHDDGTNFTRMNAYYDNGTDFVLMG